MIVHERRPPPTLAQRRATQRALWSPILTATLVCTAVIALCLTVAPETQGVGVTWWLAGYALVAGSWGCGRIINAAAAPMEERQ